MYKQKHTAIHEKQWEEKIMNEFVFSYSTKVYFGKGAVAKALRAELGQAGNTVMLAYGGGFCEEKRHLR